jgi:F0F1-type ATP synthase assembly protein I
MNDAKKQTAEARWLEDKSTWAIGGGVLLGIGVGFFFLPGSPFGFVGSLLAGLGLGLIVTAVLSVLRRG